MTEGAHFRSSLFVRRANKKSASVLRERFPAAHVTHRATKRAPCVAIYFQVAAATEQRGLCLNVLSTVSLSRSARVYVCARKPSAFCAACNLNADEFSRIVSKLRPARLLFRLHFINSASCLCGKQVAARSQIGPLRPNNAPKVDFSLGNLIILECRPLECNALNRGWECQSKNT